MNVRAVLRWMLVVVCVVLSWHSAAADRDSGSRKAAAAPSVVSSAAAAAGKSATSGFGLQSDPGTSQAVRVVLGLTVLAVLPALLVCVTSFLRIVIVLSMLRHAIGMPETPPNPAVIGIAIFLTLFTMAPVLHEVNRDAFEPFMNGAMQLEPAYTKGTAPLREFMAKQTREEDLSLMVELSRAKPPASIEEVSLVQLVPAFMLSELRAAFQIGVLVFLPFVLIDLVVSAVLMALGMVMLPPSSFALPLKILVFVLVDGWALLVKALVGSFH
jgi:flagellar biosynthetic protein FliP